MNFFVSSLISRIDYNAYMYSIHSSSNNQIYSHEYMYLIQSQFDRWDGDSIKYLKHCSQIPKLGSSNNLLQNNFIWLPAKKITLCYGKWLTLNELFEQKHANHILIKRISNGFPLVLLCLEQAELEIWIIHFKSELTSS